jgi:citrate lyase subunit beta/citryl-CoA lyase
VTPLRSILFVPGTRADRFDKAFASGADAVVLDLEDSVDATRKDEARRAIADWLAASSASRTARFVRVNAPRSAWIDDDLRWLAPMATQVEGVVLPKTESATDVERVGDAVQRPVIPLLETSRGILGADSITGANAQVPALLFGAEDLTAELGIPRTLEGEELLFARSRVVLAAATIGADAIDAVFVDLKSPDRLRQDAARARALGFRGKMAIHPDQIAVIHDVFSPSPDEIAAARRLIDADEAAQARGDGVYRVDDRMVDAPIVARARRLLALADALEQK